jgi:DNA-binding response OmpR family regulator
VIPGVAWNEISFSLLQEINPDIVLFDEQVIIQKGISMLSLIRAFDDRIAILSIASLSSPGFLQADIDDFIHARAPIEEICTRLQGAWNKKQRANRRQEVVILSPSTTYNLNTGKLVICNQVYALKPTLAILFQALCVNQGRQLSTTYLCKHIWNNDDAGKARQLNNYICELRKYLKPDTDLAILTRYGIGYMLCRDDQ